MSVIDEVAAERTRQVLQEGWDVAHDDDHTHGEMALAAGWYALNAANRKPCEYGVDDARNIAHGLFLNDHYGWPWLRRWWKPSNARRDLIKAAALIVAEIERLDRAEAINQTNV